MAVFKAVRKDLGTGSITGASQQSYVVPYFVFTDNNTEPYNIYEQARSVNGIMIYDENNNATNKKLPVYGTVDSTTYVSNINIERASENNLIAVPQYGLAVNQNRDSSWTCWLYTVTFSASDTTTITTADAPWDRDTAISCSLSPKTYERYDNKTLIPNYTASKKNDANALLAFDEDNLDDTPVPNYPVTKAKYQNLRNTVGDDLYRNRTVFNYLLNFTYAVRRFDAEWLAVYMNTMNLEDCVVCGIPIPKYHAAINEIHCEQAEWNGHTYYNVSVEVEIQYQQRITYDELVSSGHRAFMIEGKSSKIDEYLNKLKSGLTKEKAGFVYKITDSDTVKKYPVPIEELTDIRQRDEIPDRRWFMKKKNLGYFEDIFKLEDNIEVVPIPKRVYIVSGDYPPTQKGQTLVVKYSADVENTETGTFVTLYYTGQSKENSYMYSIYNPESADYKEKDPTQFRFMSTSTITIVDSDLSLYNLNANGTTTIYKMLKYVKKHSQTKIPADPFQGQYNTIQSPLALNKFGGVYFSKDESNTVDDVTEPGKIDMYDPMLGKVRDYQHVARDWKALAFPRKGMFWSTSGGNKIDMSKGSKFFS